MKPGAKKDAQEWGRYRAQELVRDMRSLAPDYASQFDMDAEHYLSIALDEVRKTLREKS